MSYAKSILGFMAGASIGAMAGILLAPDKGTATRRKITDHTSDLKDLLKDWTTEFIDSLQHAEGFGSTENEKTPDMNLNTMG